MELSDFQNICKRSEYGNIMILHQEDSRVVGLFLGLANCPVEKNVLSSKLYQPGMSLEDLAVVLGTDAQIVLTSRMDDKGGYFIGDVHGVRLDQVISVQHY